MKTEQGYVIERYMNSALYYWNGKSVAIDGFTDRHHEAIRFARESDATEVLHWLLDGMGRVTMHVWSEGDPT